MVKGPAGQFTPDILKACEDHFSRVYPECVNSSDHGPIMCPAAFKFGYVAPRGEASGATRLTDIEEVNFNGDAAELKLFEALETLTKQPMCVLSKFKFKDFTREVLKKILPNHPTSVKFQDLEGEVDFVIAHRRIGVILIEVKAMSEFKKGEYNRAKKQLKNGEEIIQALLHGIGINIRVHKVIALPNLSDHGRATPDFINLRKFNVRSHYDFQLWWTTNFGEVQSGSSELEKMQKLIAILVGEWSAVSSPAKVLSDVFKQIDTQKFLERSFDKRATVDELDAVRKTKEPGLTTLAKQFMFLNPEQQRIWNGPCRQVFCGVAGSGKTILLQFKALECAKKGEKVLVVVPKRLTELYKQFFEINNVLSKVELLSFWGFWNRMNWTKLEGKFHLFVDEWQLIWGDHPVNACTCTFDALDGLSQDDSCYFWMTYDDKQWSSKPESATESDWWLLIHNLDKKVGFFLRRNALYHAASLTTNMRSTVQVYSYWDRASRVIKSFDCLANHRCNCIGSFDDDFPLREYWSCRFYLGHHICGPSVTEIHHARRRDILQVIKHEIKSWAKDGEVYSFHKVAILLTRGLVRLRKFLGNYLWEKGILTCRVGSNYSRVVVDDGELSHSYEWPVVIAICTRNAELNYLMFSRAVTRLVVLYDVNV